MFISFSVVLVVTLLALPSLISCRVHPPSSAKFHSHFPPIKFCWRGKGPPSLLRPASLFLRRPCRYLRTRPIFRPIPIPILGSLGPIMVILCPFPPHICLCETSRHAWHV
ncbi:hypothetical protein C8J57DRAFT_1341621 [Mycena rebaudengoi]|nr:hypothetical protein C8J57DRAFT_1341621 [Mycena rebaudengoi]